jgi:hypothetical protein
MTSAREAEESSLLEAVVRERLLETAGWVAVLLLVVPSGVYKWSINSIPTPCPVYSRTIKYMTVTIHTEMYMSPHSIR